MAKIAGKFHPTRIWRGYASSLVRRVMPLAKFIYGDTHKWYFRTAGTVLAAIFVAAIRIRFSGDALWVSYLGAFGAVSLVYWCIYAPAKWAVQDCVREPQGTYDFNFSEMLKYEQSRTVLIAGGFQEGKLDPPPEIELLGRYVQLHGRLEVSGQYRFDREWRPPCCWAGEIEFQLLSRMANDRWEECLTALGYEPEAFRTFENLWGSQDIEDKQNLSLLKMVVTLDVNRPEWREHAIAWDGGRWSLVRWRLRRLPISFFKTTSGERI